MKLFLICFLLNLAFTLSKSFYDIKINTIQGQEYDMSKLKGKTVLIANVASECGYTQQGYKNLNYYHDNFNKYGLVVLGVPCNQFGRQEPGSNGVIEIFAKMKMLAQFQLLEKVEVNGGRTHDLYRFLKGEFLPADHPEKNLVAGDIRWNFEYFLVNKHGEVVYRWPTGSDLTQPQAESYISSVLWDHPQELKEDL